VWDTRVLLSRHPLFRWDSIDFPLFPVSGSPRYHSALLRPSYYTSDIELHEDTPSLDDWLYDPLPFLILVRTLGPPFELKDLLVGAPTVFATLPLRDVLGTLWSQVKTPFFWPRFPPRLQVNSCGREIGEFQVDESLCDWLSGTLGSF